MYDYGVFIARMQPVHYGHLHVIRDALKRVKHLIVLIGSADGSPDPRNPFTFEQRRKMLENTLEREFDWDLRQRSKRVTIKPIADVKYADDLWTGYVQGTVNNIILDQNNPSPTVTLHGLKDFSVALVGHSKDASSYYLKMFPQWDNIEIDNWNNINATDIRAALWHGYELSPLDVPKDVHNFLIDYSMSDEGNAMALEAEYYRKYPAQWGKGPHITADAVVVQAGHVLLITRKHLPGKGLLALPGGFMDEGEFIIDACVRELRQETKISDHKGVIPEPMLRSLIDTSATRIFDDPNRSLRGRVITHAYLFKMPAAKRLTMTGSDDASHAEWYPVGELRPDMLFEDHYHIIQRMLG